MICIRLFFSVIFLALTQLVFASGFSSANVSWKMDLSNDARKIESRVFNSSNVPLACAGSFYVGLENSFGREVAMRNINYNGIIFLPQREYRLEINIDDVKLDKKNVLFSEFESFDDKFKCHKVKLNSDTIRVAVETGLRNNHFDYAKDIYDEVTRVPLFKILNLSGSYYNLDMDSIELEKEFNLNHAEIYSTQTFKKNIPSNVECNKRKSIMCGYKYFAKRSEKCLPEVFIRKESSFCTVKRYRKCYHDKCGRERWWDGKRKRCRRKECGVESYNACRDKRHGVERYQVCRDRSHGNEDVLSCLTKINTLGEILRCSNR